MEIKSLIDTAVANGQKALSEFDAKKVMAAYHIPVSREYLAATKDDAVQKAVEIGFPVVLKACSHTIAHKTEHSLVEASITGEDQVRQAFDRIMARSPEKLDGILVQEMVKGQRELMLGLFCDPQFGPCVSIGFGGIMTEIIHDTCFRMAPVDLIEARDMLDEFKTRKMLGPFRGQQPVDTDALCRAIVAVGAAGLENPAISEIDINPIIVRHDGTFAAVDALVVLEGEDHDQNS